MKQSNVQIGPVAYNAATQCFEALVTVHDGGTTKKFPCAIEAPISMSFERATQGLKKQALRRLDGRKGLQSQMRKRVAEVRAGRPGFDPRNWLAHLGLGSIDRAA
jgi:hypothetical protein